MFCFVSLTVLFFAFIAWFAALSPKFLADALMAPHIFLVVAAAAAVTLASYARIRYVLMPRTNASCEIAMVLLNILCLCDIFNLRIRDSSTSYEYGTTFRL